MAFKKTLSLRPLNNYTNSITKLNITKKYFIDEIIFC